MKFQNEYVKVKKKKKKERRLLLKVRIYLREKSGVATWESN